MPNYSKAGKILSFGAGVNSSTILLLHSEISFNQIVFADTKAELPETYSFLKQYVKPFCHKNNIPFCTVTKGDLFSYYWVRQIIPSRRFRHCTDKFKIRPIQKVFGKVKYILGIDYGERQRALRFRNQNFDFPLIDLELTRDDCKDIIKKSDWPIPVKSGCYFCPFQKKEAWIRLLKKHKSLFLKAEAFEKNCKSYPKFSLAHQPLQQLRESVENQISLCNWIDPENNSCVFCHA